MCSTFLENHGNLGFNWQILTQWLSFKTKSINDYSVDYNGCSIDQSLKLLSLWQFQTLTLFGCTKKSVGQFQRSKNSKTERIVTDYNASFYVLLTLLKSVLHGKKWCPILILSQDWLTKKNRPASNPQSKISADGSGWYFWLLSRYIAFIFFLFFYCLPAALSRRSSWTSWKWTTRSTSGLTWTRARTLFFTWVRGCFSFSWLVSNAHQIVILKFSERCLGFWKGKKRVLVKKRFVRIVPEVSSFCLFSVYVTSSAVPSFPRSRTASLGCCQRQQRGKNLTVDTRVLSSKTISQLKICISRMKMHIGDPETNLVLRFVFRLLESSPEKT